jgi:hypothetical protein
VPRAYTLMVHRINKHGNLQVTAQSAINKLLNCTLHYDVQFHLAP